MIPPKIEVEPPFLMNKNHFFSPKNSHQLKNSAKLQFKSKKDEKQTNHMNVINDKLKKKKKFVKVDFKKEEERDPSRITFNQVDCTSLKSK